MSNDAVPAVHGACCASTGMSLTSPLSDLLRVWRQAPLLSSALSRLMTHDHHLLHLFHRQYHSTRSVFHAIGIGKMILKVIISVNVFSIIPRIARSQLAADAKAVSEGKCESQLTHGHHVRPVAGIPILPRHVDLAD